MKLLACNSNPSLSQNIASYLGSKLVNVEIKRFADMEVFAEIKENVRGKIFLFCNRPHFQPMTI